MESVVRGISSDCSVVTGTLPPEAARVSIEDALVVVQLAFGGFQHRDLHGARGVASGGNIFAPQPFLADHSSKHGLGDARRGAECFFADKARALRAKLDSGSKGTTEAVPFPVAISCELHFGELGPRTQK